MSNTHRKKKKNSGKRKINKRKNIQIKTRLKENGKEKLYREKNIWRKNDKIPFIQIPPT